MAEEYILTEPVVETTTVTTNKYKIISMLLDREAINPITPAEPGLVNIILRDNNDMMIVCQYTGNEAIDLIKFMNTANFSVNSMNKRTLQKLSADGKLPPGTVTGVPE